MKRFISAFAVGCLTASASFACPPEYQPPETPAPAEQARAVPARDPAALARRYIRLISDERSDKPYIGVLMSPIPEALAAHVGDDGLMVANIVKGSPADTAGLQRYDVLRSANGKTLSDMSDLSEIVQGGGIDGKVDLTLVRNGKEQTITLTAAARPTGETEYKYEQDQTTVYNAPTFHGHRLRVGPGGNIDLDDLGDLNNLPDHVRDLLDKLESGQGWNWSINNGNGPQVWSQSNSESVFTQMENGKTLTVRRHGDGKIDVERIDEQGAKTSAAYGDADALKKADQEAFDAMQQHLSGGNAFSWRVPSGQTLPMMRGQYQDAINAHLRSLLQQRDTMQQQWNDLRQQLQNMPALRDHLDQLRKSMQDSQDQLRAAHDALLRARDADANADDDSSNDSAADQKAGVSDDISANIASNGRIRIIVRKNGATMTYEFKDKKDFQNREPELFKRFQSLSN